MDTNNLDKWWYGLPENTRQAIGNDGIWEKLDMPSRSALKKQAQELLAAISQFRLADGGMPEALPAGASPRLLAA